MKKFSIESINISTNALKVIGLVGAGVTLITTLAGTELKRRENIETINKVVDERLTEHYASMKASAISN